MAVLCWRCSRNFNSFYAHEQHVANSHNHWKCPGQECNFDGCTRDEMFDHCRQTGCQTVCQGCTKGNGAIWDPDSKGYWQHVFDENVCTACSRHFDTQDNLFHHELSHRPPNYPCYQCNQMFKTYGGMIIHLEYGTCSSLDGLFLNQLAAECRRWREFVFEDCYLHMLNREDVQFYLGNRVDLYACPLCKTPMRKLSSLFQHVESRACGQTLHDGSIGELKRYLDKCLNAWDFGGSVDVKWF